ncbi:cellulose biosynthesis protein BcsG [Escherichia coli]|nr:cellulose biosynthesis protein BcsG [Escherichia coli]
MLAPLDALPIGFACSGMNLVAWPGKHNEPGFAGGGVQYRLFNRPCHTLFNWQMIGAIFVLLVAWLFLSQWIRITVFVVAILLWLNVLPWGTKSLWSGNRRPLYKTGGNAAERAATGGAPVVGDMPHKLHRQQREPTPG